MTVSRIEFNRRLAEVFCALVLSVRRHLCLNFERSPLMMMMMLFSRDDDVFCRIGLKDKSQSIH